MVDTDFHGMEKGQAEYTEFLEQSCAIHPLQRVANTDDCVNAIAFLASSNADFVTGVIFLVDGKLFLYSKKAI